MQGIRFELRRWRTARTRMPKSNSNTNVWDAIVDTSDDAIISKDLNGIVRDRIGGRSRQHRDAEHARADQAQAEEPVRRFTCEGLERLGRFAGRLNLRL